MALDPKIRINLDRSVVLLVQQNSQAMDALTAMFRGFGVRKQFKAATGAEAMHVVKTQELDLIVTDSHLPDMDGYDFVRWLRRETGEPTSMIPVVMVTGHASQSQVAKSRDCGASFIVAKPLTPTVLLQRILWLASDERVFVQSANYVGPDRRVNNFGPPLNMPGRRHDDLSAHVGAAVEANMDQSDIDSFFKPKRVAL